jgi:ubiquinone biosynthesis protein COQ9
MSSLKMLAPLRCSHSQKLWRSFHINRLRLSQQALYHSYEHPSQPPYSSTAESILSASVAHIPQHGFTQKSLQLGAKDAGFMSISTNLFPRGVFDLIAYYLMTKRLALQNSVNGENGYAKIWAENKIGVGSRVKTLLLERLNMNAKAGIIKKWPEVSIISCLCLWQLKNFLLTYECQQ